MRSKSGFILGSFLFIVFLFLLNSKVVGAVPAITEGNYNKPDEVLDYLDEHGYGMLGNNGYYHIYLGGKQVNLNTNMYNEEGIVFYGNASTVSSDLGINNERDNGVYRYLGLSADSMVPVTNYNFPDDVQTTGDVAGRDYSERFWETGIHGDSYYPGSGIFNNKEDVYILSLTSNNPLKSPSEAQEMIDRWLLGIVDKYADHHSYWRSISGNFDRTSTENEFLKMTPKQRRDRIYISMPPTAYTWGLGVTTQPCGSNHCYDTFPIKPTSLVDGGYDFEAVEMEEVKGNSYYYEMNMKARNIGMSGLEKDVPTKWSYRINGGSWKEAFGYYHGSDWEIDNVNRGMLGYVNLGVDVEEGDEVEYRATINPVDPSTGEYYIEESEDKRDNNTISGSFIVEGPAVCEAGGFGSVERYANRSCDGEGNCNITWHNYILSNVTEMELSQDVTTLTGDWTRTDDHKHVDAPLVEGMNPEDDEFDLTFEDKLRYMSDSELEESGINPDMVKSLKELGVEDTEIRKIIRAGRSLELGGTIKLDFNLNSFDSYGDNEDKRNEFINIVLEELRTYGIEVDDGQGITANANGETKTKAMYDDRREGSYVDGKHREFKEYGDIDANISIEETKRRTRTYGNYRELDVYSNEYEVYIPVVTENEEGKQEVEGGKFNDGTYDVGDGIYSYYTDVRLMDGKYGLTFGSKMDISVLDPGGLSGEVECLLNPQIFYIEGDIYDDIRSEDNNKELEEREDEEGKWDFGF